MKKKLTLPKIRRGLLKTSRALGDTQAVRKGKVPARVVRRGAGKLVGRLLRLLTK